MKRFASVLALCLLVGIAIAAVSRSKAKPQLPVQTNSTITWNKQSADVALSNDQLEVKFDSAFTNTRWRIGVHVASVTQAKVTVGLLSLQADQNKPFMKQIESVVNWPTAGINNQAGKIEYLGAPATNDIAVHVVLPTGKRLEVKAGTNTLFASNVSQDILIDSKGVTQKPMGNMATLMVVSLITPMTSMSDVITTSTGAKLVSLGNLKAHLQSSLRPSYPAGAQTDQIENVVIKGTINTQGNIVNTSVLRGSQVFANSCLTALNSWHFNPFVIEGAASDVIAIFVFGFDPNGTVLVPAMGDGAL